MGRLILVIMSCLFLAVGHAPASSGTVELLHISDATDGITAQINIERQRKGRSALRRNSTLDATALAHAEDMARRGYFAHESPEGSTPMQRATRLGYRPCLIAENIAQGYRGAPDVVAGWMKSSGHRKNMLLRKVTEFGAAKAPGDICVLVLAMPGC